MNQFFRDLSTVTEDTLSQMLTAQVPESKDIEYKRDATFKDQKNQQTFLKEVVAFANSSGGDIFYGIEAIDGLPVKIDGLPNFNFDGTVLQLQNLLRSHVQPRLFGVKFHPVVLGNGGTVLIVRVPKVSGPFMVDHKFFIRSGPEARPMDFVEVSRSFIESETTANQLRNFRLERCARILGKEGPVEIEGSHLTVLHVVPLDSIAQSHRFSMSDLMQARFSLWPLGASGATPGVDLDGVFQYARTSDKTCAAYTMLMRNGAIEAVEGDWLQPWAGNKGDSQCYIPYGATEPGIVEALKRILAVFKTMDMIPPFVVFLSLLNVKGFTIPTEGLWRPWSGPKPIKLDHLHLPEIIIQGDEPCLFKAMKPAFDSIWNACGMVGSLNYDDKGEWKLRE